MTYSANNNKGFTLLEILLAFFIFSIVIGIIYSSYSGSFTTIKMTESRMEMYRKAAIAMDRISSDLQAVYISVLPPDSFGEPLEATRFVGGNNEINGREADSMEFFSRIGPLFEDDDNVATGQLITYDVIQGEKEDELVLLRSEHDEFVDQSEEREGLVLCDGLQAVKFTFIDTEGEEHEGWDSDSEEYDSFLPRMVSVSLAFLNHENPDEPQVFETGVALPEQYLLPGLLSGSGTDNTSAVIRRTGIRTVGADHQISSGNLTGAI